MTLQINLITSSGAKMSRVALLHILFRYDESSPTGLVWACERRSGKNGYILEALEGDVCGDIRTDGYSRVPYNGKRLLAHRVIYELFYGEIPEGYDVDHLDGDRLNNNKDNLRLATKTINARNHSKSKANTSGITGVVYQKDKLGYESFNASWRTTSGERKSKSFSFKKFGKDVALNLACEARKNAIESMNWQGAGYTNRHKQHGEVNA